ncbi:MAG TPA: hypothetical protein VE219_04200, partial [Candidatus Sulfotelmatobacter sp.]|nr:hypothetical protein [Candidatus Sulfotelmatobacter sp.]
MLARLALRPSRREGAWSAVRQTVQRRPATILVGAAVAAFVALWWDVLAGQHVLIGYDLLYSWLPWSQSAGAHPPRNVLAGDPVTQYGPWLKLTRDALLHFRLPLWNPYSSSGAPLLANGQSGVFSPFTLVVLPFHTATALTVGMFVKMWVAGIGMALFVRQLGARPVAATFAGVVFATSSFMVVWLAYPPASAAALVPWLLAAIEWYLRSRRPTAFASIAVLVALEIFAGHYETSLQVALVLPVYVIARIFGLRRPRASVAAGLVLAGVL